LRKPKRRKFSGTPCILTRSVCCGAFLNWETKALSGHAEFFRQFLVTLLGQPI